MLSVTLVDPRRCSLPLSTSSAARAALCGVMESLRHQFVLPVLKCVATVSNDGEARVAVLRCISKRGSLRDRLHRAGNPKASAWDKYHSATRAVEASSPLPGAGGGGDDAPGWRPPGSAPKGLPIAEVRQRSRQVLEALLYLRQRRIRMIHLHVGNVIVRERDDASCVSDMVEDVILNLPTERDALVPRTLADERASYYETECLYCFGRFVYHLVAGRAPGPLDAADAAGPRVPEAIADDSVPAEVRPRLPPGHVHSLARSLAHSLARSLAQVRSILASMLLPRRVAADVVNSVRVDSLEDVASR